MSRQLVIRQGQFRLNLRACTRVSADYLTRFSLLLRPGVLVGDVPVPGWWLTLILPETVGEAETVLIAGDPDGVWAKLHRAWTSLEPVWAGASLLLLANDDSDNKTREYVYLVGRDTPEWQINVRLAQYACYIKGQWLLAQGGVPVHASCVVRRGQGFVFLGPSGAGKSTAARLSLAATDGILHDDRIFVVPQGDFFTLSSIPNPLALLWLDGEDPIFAEQMTYGQCLSSTPTLPHAMFLLRQDTSDYLVPVPSLVLARTLLQAYLDALTNLPLPPGLTRFSAAFLRLATRDLCRLAHRVRGFELHFRESPDFWRLIDERFPD